MSNVVVHLARLVGDETAPQDLRENAADVLAAYCSAVRAGKEPVVLAIDDGVEIVFSKAKVHARAAQEDR